MKPIVIRRSLLVLCAAGALWACKPDATEPASGTNSATNSATNNTTAQTTAAPEKVTVWEIEVTGQPKLSGDSVQRKETSSGGQVVTFFGAPAIARVDLSPDAELVGFRIGYTADKVSCVYDAGATATKLEFTLKDSRGELQGEIPCGPDGNDSEAKPAKVSAWFNADLKKLPQFKATDFRPGKDGKITITKDGPKVGDE